MSKKLFTLSELVITIAIIGIFSLLVSTAIYNSWLLTNKGIDNINLTHQLKSNYSILARDFKNSKSATIEDNTLTLLYKDSLEIVYTLGKEEGILYKNNIKLIEQVKILNFELIEIDLLRIEMQLRSEKNILTLPQELYVLRRK